MSKNLDGIVAAIRDKRAKKRPEVEKNLQKIDALLAALRDTRGRADAVANSNRDLKEALNGVSFNEAEKLLGKARIACEDALKRLRRDSINIGVAGKARQGKSKILQMLTGLGDNQIPTGDGDFCTATLNIVRNGGTKTATVFYLTETDVLTQMVYPSFAPTGTEWGVGLESPPKSLSAFLGTTTYPSSEQVKKGGASSTAQANWGKVLDLQADLQDDALRAHLGKSPEQLSDMNSIRDFLVKDGGQKIYQTVDHVEIVTPFPDNLPSGMTVYDIPGLEDPTAGIKEKMLRTVANDADIVFFLRLPASSGDGWGTSDGEAFDMLRKVYPPEEVDINDWVQVILNHWPAKNNTERAKGMKASAKEKYGIDAVVCNCGDQDEVREMVDSHIDALVNQAGRIDDLRIRQADAAVSTALGQAKLLLGRLRSLTFDIVAPDFDLDEHVDDFMSDLRGPLREEKMKGYFTNELIQKVRGSLTRHFSSAKAKMNELYAEFGEKDRFPEEFPIFSKQEIFKLVQRKTGAVGALEDAVRTQREAVLKLLRDQLSLCCAELREEYFSLVAERGFASNEALRNIVPETIGLGEDKMSFLRQFSTAFQSAGAFPWLDAAMENLLRFDLSFDNTILPWIYGIDDFADFDPDYRSNKKSPKDNEEGGCSEDSESPRDGKGREFRMVRDQVSNQASFEATAEYIFGWMQTKTIMILEELTSPAERNEKLISGISRHVARAMESNFDSFVYRFIWGKPVEREWKRFAEKNKTVFWRKDYEEAAAHSQLKKEWDGALAGFAMAITAFAPNVND